MPGKTRMGARRRMHQQCMATGAAKGWQEDLELDLEFIAFFLIKKK